MDNDRFFVSEKVPPFVPYTSTVRGKKYVFNFQISQTAHEWTTKNNLNGTSHKDFPSETFSPPAVLPLMITALLSIPR